MSTLSDDLVSQVRCAFCLNQGATNEVAVKDASGNAAVAYLCDDCVKDHNRLPKFGHKVDEENKKVQEIQLEEEPKPVTASPAEAPKSAAADTADQKSATQ